MSHTHNEWWRWQLNRKIAEFLSKPTPQQEATLGFLLTSYRALHEQENIKLYQENDMP
jgi:hypothetical protein